MILPTHLTARSHKLPRPALPHSPPAPHVLLSYYYQDPGYTDYSYKYVDDGNHGNSNYGYEYDTHLDHNNHNITYPKRDTQATPRSWYAEGSEYSTPDEIEQSCHLGPGLKRCRYRNFRTPRYRVTQPRPPLVPCPPPELDDDTTFDTPPPPTTHINKHHTNNHTPKPPRNINFDTTPYLTSQLHPPPWPNKISNKNRNKYYYGTHTPAGTMTR